MAGSAQHTTTGGFEGEDVPGTTEVGWFGFGIDERFDGFGAVGGRDACGTAVSNEVDRDSEGSLMERGILAYHEVEAKLFAAVFNDGSAYEPAAILGHKVDDFGGGIPRSGDEIAFVLAVFIVYYYNQFAFGNVFNGRFDSV
jgi:hypothetical protein